MTAYKDWYGSVEYKMAKMGGFKKKKPKKPKSKTVASMKRYIEKHDKWVRELKEYAKKGKEKYNLQEKIKKL
jgi:ADP-glucose pyrophosphorylase